MKCKYCDSELVEGKDFCPACGRAQNEVTETAEVEAKPEIKEGMKATPGKIAIAVAAVVVVLAVLIALIAGGMKDDLFAKDPTEAPTEAVETVPPATIPADGNPDDVTCKGSYSAADEDAKAASDTVVATMGGEELTNGLLQVFYWEEVYAFLQEYGSYAPYLGLDYSQPLDVQTCQMAESPMTWQQYFLQSAINTWRGYQAMALVSRDNAFEMDADTRAYLDGLYDNMSTQAASQGYQSVEDMVLGFVGAGPDADDYIRYVELYHEGYAYFSDVYDNTHPTTEEVEAYFLENEASYAEQGITRDSGVHVDIRHILIMPDGGETGSDGYPVYTDEAWAAAKEEAEKLFEEWKNGELTEERFAQMAREHSVDGSAANGGLYTDVYEGQMVENFNNWCFDEIRQVGDYDLVQTQFGYHLMYFSGSRDIWYSTAEYDLISQIVSAILPAALEQYPAEVDYSAIKLGVVSLG